MRKATPRRNAVTGTALTLLTFLIGLMLAVLVAGSASAKTKPKTSPKTKPAKTPATLPAPVVAPADKFTVINGTVNAASDHEIVGSSAFPNYTTGAVDNYYTMAHSHVDNSPFAEGTASPFDTGPVGQTAAAGNFQQPQYADARWPGGPDNAAYGSQGGPYATAAADNNRAGADASEPSNHMSGPGLHGTKTLAVPKGFDVRLQQALSAWDAKWPTRLGMKKPTPPVKTPPAPVTVPSSPVKPPSVTVTTPQTSITPSVTVPSPKLPSVGGKSAARSPASVSTPQPPASLPAVPRPKTSAPAPGGMESLLSSSTLATLVYKTDGSKANTSEKNTCKTDTVAAGGTTGTAATTTTTTTTTKTKDTRTCELLTRGESSMGRVTIGGGLIVIEGIHVTASITNDGTTPSYTASVSVASASIAGIPVTIDANGVHVAGQGQGLPYKQASDALNSALNKAGIQIFLVQPEVTDCSQTGSGTGTGTTATTTTTTTTTSSQSGTTSPCGQSGPAGGASCDQSSTGSGGTPGVPAPTPAPTSTQSSTTTTPSSCGQTGTSDTSCGQGTGTTGTTTTTSGGSPAIGGSPTTTTTSTNQSSTTTTQSSCDQSGMGTSPSSCSTAGTPTGTTTTSSDQSAAPPMSGSTFQFGPGPGTSNSGEETVTATGVHIVFTQPVSPPGVPAQFVEHILGEVFVDSLASPAAPLPAIGGLSGSSLSSSSPSSSCLGAGGSHSKVSRSGFAASGGGGSSSVSGSGSASSGSGVLSASSPSSASGATSQPGATSTGNTLPARFASALHKPLWLLLAYLVWQLIVIGTGWSVWKWRRGGA